MKWSEIERIGRELYNLSDEWHLSFADAGDPFTMEIRFQKKGPRGGWLRGEGNEIKGFIPNYPQYMNK